MKKKIYRLGGLLVMLMFTLTGCNSWLDAKPEDRMTDEELFSSVQGFRTALNGIYVELNDRALYGGSLLATTVEVLAQRYDFSGNTTDVNIMAKFDYTTDYSKSQFAAIWEKAYALIANCNKLLEYAEINQHVLTGDTRQLIMGEVYALRAFLHFDILRLYGPIYIKNKKADAIPYNTRYSISASSILPAEEVIGKILKDLEMAEGLLEESDPIVVSGPGNVDAEDGLNTTTFRPQRFNYYAVKALQARVNLYADNKVEAVRAAKVVTAIQEKWFPFTKYNQVMGTKNADRIFSSEILFALYHSARNDIFTDFFSPSVEPAKVYLPKKNLDAFFIQERDKDWRYSSTWLENSERDYKCFYKYENINNGGYINHLIPLIRITEMYYIIAEASTDPTEALAAINTVMYNRGLSEVKNQADIAAMVKEEYKREFWGEGQLFFYYKRINQPTIFSYSENKNMTMDETNYVIPMPLSETDFR